MGEWPGSCKGVNIVKNLGEGNKFLHTQYETYKNKFKVATHKCKSPHSSSLLCSYQDAKTMKDWGLAHCIWGKIYVMNGFLTQSVEAIFGGKSVYKAKYSPKAITK